MSFPVAGGMPDYSSTGYGFIPEIWSGKALEKFYLSTVLAAIANTDYEGEIKAYGDKVHIRTIPDIEINDYVAGQTLKIQRPGSTKVELKIDKGHYFNFIVDDVLKRQMDGPWVDKWSDDAGQQMKIKIDNKVLNAIYSKVHAKNKGATAGAQSGGYNIGAAGSPVGLQKSNVLDYIVDLGLVLDEQNVPEDGRWLVFPAWACGHIKKSDLKDASISGDNTSILRNGRIGMIDRFTIYSSNNLTSVVDGADTCWHALAGHKSAMTFASQFTEMDTLKSESTFGQLVRGLNVYGYEVLHPEALVDFYIKKA